MPPKCVTSKPAQIERILRILCESGLPATRSVRSFFFPVRLDFPQLSKAMHSSSAASSSPFAWTSRNSQKQGKARCCSSCEHGFFILCSQNLRYFFFPLLRHPNPTVSSRVTNLNREIISSTIAVNGNSNLESSTLLNDLSMLICGTDVQEKKVQQKRSKKSGRCLDRNT